MSPLATDFPKVPSATPYVMPVTQSRQETAASPFFVEGNAYETDERVVAITTSAVCTCKAGDREFTASLGMHEILIARRMYEEMGGSVIVLPYLAAAVPRHRALNTEQFKAELVRMREAYRMPRENRVLEFCNDYLGTEPGEQTTRLQAAMKKQFAAWSLLRTEALQRLADARKKNGDTKALHAAVLESMCWGYINERELEGIAKLLSPTADNSLESIELVPMEAPAAPAAEGPVAAEGAGDIDKNFDALMAAGLNEGQANQVLAAAEAAGAFGVVADDVLAGIVGKERLKAVRKALK
jgi:hypothetical protein